jgi:hypothetical protein
MKNNISLQVAENKINQIKILPDKKILNIFCLVIQNTQPVLLQKSRHQSPAGKGISSYHLPKHLILIFTYFQSKKGQGKGIVVTTNNANIFS